MDQLLDNLGATLSEAIEDLTPALSGNRIERRTLDGQLHVQVIGAESKAVEFKCYSVAADRDKINLAQFRGTPVRVEFDGLYYIGKVSEQPKWKEVVVGELTDRIYESVLKVAVESEGAI